MQKEEKKLGSSLAEKDLWLLWITGWAGPNSFSEWADSCLLWHKRQVPCWDI